MVATIKERKLSKSTVACHGTSGDTPIHLIEGQKKKKFFFQKINFFVLWHQVNNAGASWYPRSTYDMAYCERKCDTVPGKARVDNKTINFGTVFQVLWDDYE